MDKVPVEHKSGLGQGLNEELNRKQSPVKQQPKQIPRQRWCKGSSSETSENHTRVTSHQENVNPDRKKKS